MAAKIIHVEVAGKDGPKLQHFYSDVFGWTSTRTTRAATACCARAK